MTCRVGKKSLKISLEAKLSRESKLRRIKCRQMCPGNRVGQRHYRGQSDRWEESSGMWRVQSILKQSAELWEATTRVRVLGKTVRVTPGWCSDSPRFTQWLQAFASGFGYAGFLSYTVIFQPQLKPLWPDRAWLAHSLKPVYSMASTTF